MEDYLSEENAITLVEWPEKSKRYFNNPDYIIELNHCDNDEKRLINNHKGSTSIDNLTLLPIIL